MQRVVLVMAVVLLPSVASAQVTGNVVDGSTNLPIAGARVTVQASANETYTDANGAFEIAQASGSVVIVAAAHGWFEGGQTFTAPASGVEIALDPVPQWDDPGYTFPSPGGCGGCHPFQYSQWWQSPMGKAGRNTWVYDTYDGSGSPGGAGGFVYLSDSALAAENPASECASCHQPEPWIETPYSALEPIDSLSPEAMHGVSCVVCHQMADIDETKPNFPGMWPGVVTFQKPPPGEVVMYGVLGDVTYSSPGGMRAAYQPELTSAVCAACHQDKNDPDLDGDFEEADGVISEPTYVEWLESPYADPASPRYATCAGCHMPIQPASSACVVLPDMMRPNGDVRQHTFRGTDAEFLEHALSIDVTASVEGSEIAATVTVTNDQTGHHVPTGVTVRNAILIVEAIRTSDGEPLVHTGQQVVHDLGGVGDPSQGYFAGLPGKLYAKANHDANGDGPTFFTDAAGITFDTRIPALGSDVTTYTFTPPPDGGAVTVRARVVYRRAWRALVDAKGWTTDGHGEPLEDIAPPSFGHVMASAETSLSLGGGGSGGAGGAGAGGGSAGGGDVNVEADGCSCRVGGGERGSRGGALGWALALLVAARSSRRRSRPFC